MKTAGGTIVLMSAVLVLISGFASITNASDVYAPLKPDEVRQRIQSWLKERQVTDEVQQRFVELWKSADENLQPERLLDLTVQSFALSDAKANELIQESNSTPVSLVLPRMEFLKQSDRSTFFLANVSLYYGRFLVEQRLYDEAWDVLKAVEPRQVVDPASLFFFQAVAAQGILEIRPALDAIDRLLTATERVPVRYSATATLMQADLKGLQEKSLGEVARLMADSERRLELGRAGEKVQEIQERIISNLDELIKKIEQQQSGGGGGGGNQGGNSNNPGGAAQDSSVKGSEGPGETDKKRFENKGSWGNLPEKDLTKAKNDLNKNFPSHYEQAIEKYTKKLATRQAKKAK